MDEYISKKDILDIASQYCTDDDGSCSKADVDLREMLDEIEALPSADVQSVNEWVSVKNNLPEETVKVLIYTEYNVIAYGFFTGAYYNNRPLFAMTMNRNSERSWYEEIRVSHWMPLPKPPKDGDTD